MIEVIGNDIDLNNYMTFLLIGYKVFKIWNSRKIIECENG